MHLILLRSKNLLFLLYCIFKCIFIFADAGNTFIYPMTYKYDDSVTKYGFDFYLTNQDQVKYLRDGIFSYGMIGYYNVRIPEKPLDFNDKTDVASIDNLKTAAFEISKVSTSMSKIKMTTAIQQDEPKKLNTPSYHFVSQRKIIAYNMADTCDSICTEVNALQSSFNSGDNKSAYASILKIHTQMVYLSQKNDRTEQSNAVVKTYFNLIQTHFDDGIILTNNKPSAPIYFHTTKASINGQVFRQISNFCILYSNCTQSNSLSYLMLVELFSADQISALYENFYNIITSGIPPDDLIKSIANILSNSPEFTSFKTQANLILDADLKEGYINKFVDNTIKSYKVTYPGYSTIFSNTIKSFL